MHLLRKCAYRDFLHKAHTISNKLVPKVSAQKKGGKSYDSYKYVFKFRWFQALSPLAGVRARDVVKARMLLGAPNLTKLNDY